MIAKISRGNSFRGALDYLFKGDEAEVLGGNMAGDTPRELAAEYGTIRKQKEDITAPVYHVSLSLPEGESLPPEEWERVATKYLARMGLDPQEHQHVIIQHRDTAYNHIHIVVNRVGINGTIWDPYRDHYKSRDICRQLEKEHNLAEVSSEKKTYRAKTTQAERRMNQRTGRKSEKVVVQEALNDILKKGKKLTHKAFIEALEERGIIAIPNVASTGKMSGYAFQFSARNLTGSQVGYSWKNLQELLTPAADETTYLQERKQSLQQGTPADAMRSIRGAIWEAGVRGVGFQEALSKQGWTLQAELMTKGGVSYRMEDLVNVKKLNEGLREINKISQKEREKAKAKASALAKRYYAPRRSFLEEMPTEDVLMGMLLLPQAVLFLLTLSVVVEAIRGAGVPGTPEALRVETQEIWRGADEEVSRAVALLKEGVQNGRTARGNPKHSLELNQAGGGPGIKGGGRGPDNAALGENPDRTAERDSPGTRQNEEDRRAVTVAPANDSLDNGGWDGRRDGAAPAPTGTPRDEHLTGAGAGPTGAVAEWLSLAQDVALLGGDDMAKTAAVQAKERIWARQAEALTAEGGHVRYRVTCIPRGPDRDGKERYPWIPGQRGDTETFYNSEGVQGMIPMLSRKNLEGYDIYITPITERYIHVMIDDLSGEAVERMKADGLSPTAVWETSKGNHQAIFRLERSTPAHYKDPIKETETRAGEELVRRLTQEYGGDIGSAGIKKAFRLAGFSNKKPERHGEFVRVLETQKDECPKVRELFRTLTERKLPEVVEEQKTERRAIIRGERGLTVPIGATASQDCLNAYIRETRKVEGLLKARGWTEDKSVVDYRVCEAMIRQGWARESVTYCLENLSERLAERHPDTGDYVQRTMRAAVRGASKETPASKIEVSWGSGEPSL